MNYEHIVTYTILGLYALNVVVYGFTKDIGRMAYWLFAFGITVSATWLIK